MDGTGTLLNYVNYTTHNGKLYEQGSDVCKILEYTSNARMENLMTIINRR